MARKKSKTKTPPRSNSTGRFLKRSATGELLART